MPIRALFLAGSTWSLPIHTLHEAEAVMKEIYRQPGLARPALSRRRPRGRRAQHRVRDQRHHVLAAQRRAHVGRQSGHRHRDGRQARMAHISESTAESRELPFTVEVFDASARGQALQWLARDDQTIPRQS